MKIAVKSAVVAVTLAVSSLVPALGEDMKTQGTPITVENVVDVMEIQRVTANLTNAADSAQWDVVRAILADEVDTTIGETEPGVSSVKTSDDIATRWAGFFESADRFVMHHVTSNERVFFDDPDNATVFSKGVIVVENTPAGAYAETGGMLRGYRWVSYEFGLARTDDGWEVNKVLVDYHMQHWSSLQAQE